MALLLQVFGVNQLLFVILYWYIPGWVIYSKLLCFSGMLDFVFKVIPNRKLSNVNKVGSKIPCVIKSNLRQSSLLLYRRYHCIVDTTSPKSSTKLSQPSINPLRFSAKPRQLSTKLDQVSAKPKQFSAKPQQFSTKLRQLSAKSRQFGAELRQFSINPRQLSAALRQFNTKL
jgi:hypothetical protein